ncbi:acyl-CoA dehydrogenase family protein [Nocardioides marmotae]|nr:acyl-CoA dehydrogenase family protein [Nocardioides marmotae]MBC9734439.1 acyl-CoA dehydrogenase family protein [Nocardioides marmotae]QKE00223.1 hydroxylase [Nocardioides marmotae]
MTLSLDDETTAGTARGSRLAEDELVLRAQELRELLVKEQEDTERAGHYSERIHEAFADAGFYRILTPAAFGGLELGIGTFFRVVTEVARGNPSAAWCLALGAGHALPMASYWSAEAQREAFGEGRTFIAPHRNQGGFGKAVRVDGGYVVDCTFNYCSGVPFSTHFMGTTLLQNPDGPPSQLVVVVPRESYTVLDDWGNGRTLGMQGSGSNSVVLDNVFVPDHMAVPYNWHDHVGPTPGTELHDNPLYIGRLTAFYAGEVISVAIGTAQAALDEYESIIRTRTTLKEPRVLKMETETAQRVLGRALILTDAAQSIMADVGRLHTELATAALDGGAPFTYVEDTRLRGRVHQAGQLAIQAMDLIFPNAGSSAARQGEPLQRYYRDMGMFRGHPTALIDDLAVGHGRTHLGL